MIFYRHTVTVTCCQSKLKSIPNFLLFFQFLFDLLGDLFFRSASNLPWAPEVFLACGGNFGVGQAARKTSGTERCFLPSTLTFELFYRITFTPIRLDVSNCDHVHRHVKKCQKWVSNYRSSRGVNSLWRSRESIQLP